MNDRDTMIALLVVLGLGGLLFWLSRKQAQQTATAAGPSAQPQTQTGGLLSTQLSAAPGGSSPAVQYTPGGQSPVTPAPITPSGDPAPRLPVDDGYGRRDGSAFTFTEVRFPGLQPIATDSEERGVRLAAAGTSGTRRRS